MIKIKELWEVLKEECITCDFYEKIGAGKKCSDCLFIKSSAEEKGKRSRIGISSKIYKFGVTKRQRMLWGKCHLFYYLFHPELNFEPPIKPSHDKYYKKIKPEHNWNLHHKNGIPYDDRKENLVLILCTEHPKEEVENNRKKREIKKKAKQDYNTRGLMLF